MSPQSTPADEPSVEEAGGPEIPPLPRVSVQAFCETANVSAVLAEAARDRRMAKTHFQLQMGGAAAAAEFYVSAPTPNVILLESKGGRDQLMGDLARLAEVCDAGTKVVVIGHVNDVDLYRDLLRRGINEYLCAPVDVMGVLATLSGLYHDTGAAPVGRAVAVIGAKGGVGASTVAHNVAWAVSAEFATDTIVADLDLAFGTAGLDFNQDPPQGIAEAVFAPERLDDVFLDRLLSKCGERLSLLAAPAALDRVYDLPDTAFDGLLDLLRSAVPCTVLDVPHQWTAATRAVLIDADEIVVVAAPDLANLRNAKNIIDLLKAARPNDRPPRLVLNGVGLPKRPELKPADFETALELTLLAALPFDAQLFGAAGNNGQMIGEMDAAAKPAETFAEIARILLGRGEIRKPKRSPLAPLLARLSLAKG